MVNKVTAFAPATVSNVGCGFDVLGFALEYPGDYVQITTGDFDGIAIERITGDQGVLPYQIEKNTATLPILEAIKRGHPAPGMRIEIKKDMPIGSGMGSSAASAVAGIFAYNALIGGKLSMNEMLELALIGEQMACGAAHADNAAPSLYGGFVVVRSYKPLEIVPIPAPEELYCALLHPDYELKTADSRAVLPKQISIKDATVQWGNLGGLIAALFTSDYDLIGRCVADVVAEPYRAALIPAYMAVKQAAMSTAALACNISGSGPAIFALFKGRYAAEQGGKAMLNALEYAGFKGEIYVSSIHKGGARIVESTLSR